MIDLPDVTLLAIDTIQPARAVRALRYSMRELRFKKVKLISNAAPFNLRGDIDLGVIEPLTFSEYSTFCLKKLSGYVDTAYCLLAQADGFVLNPHLWSESFLAYDYIGAPWPPDAPWINGRQDVRVGNGGFSLRSKKLLEACTLPEVNPGGHEDVNISFYNRVHMDRLGIKFAPVSVALRFSLEINLPELGETRPFTQYPPADTSKAFGFHNKNIYPHLLKLLDDSSLDEPCQKI